MTAVGRKFVKRSDRYDTLDRNKTLRKNTVLTSVVCLSESDHDKLFILSNYLNKYIIILYTCTLYKTLGAPFNEQHSFLGQFFNCSTFFCYEL